MEKTDNVLVDDIKQVELLDFPTFEMQRHLSKQYFKATDFEEVRDPEDPANPNKSLFVYEHNGFKVVATKRIQYTEMEDKVLILLLHNFLKQNNNSKKEGIKKDIPLNTLSFIKLTCDDYETYISEGALDVNKLQNERKKIKNIISNLTSIRFVEYEDKKISLFEKNWARNKTMDQYVVTFTNDLANFLSKKSKELSISFRPETIFKMKKMSYYVGSYFSHIIYIKKNIQLSRNKLTIKSILEHLSCILPSEEEIKSRHGSFASSVIYPLLNSFDDLEDADIFDIERCWNFEKGDEYSKSNHIRWLSGSVKVIPLDTFDEFNRRARNENTKKSEKNEKEAIVRQMQAFASNEDLNSTKVKALLKSLSKHLGIDYITVKKAVTNSAKAMNDIGKVVK